MATLHAVRSVSLQPDSPGARRDALTQSWLLLCKQIMRARQRRSNDVLLAQAQRAYSKLAIARQMTRYPLQAAALAQRRQHGQLPPELAILAGGFTDGPVSMQSEQAEGLGSFWRYQGLRL